MSGAGDSDSGYLVDAMLGGQVTMPLRGEVLGPALSAMSDAVFIVDAEGRPSDFNDALTVFLRLSSRQETFDFLNDPSSILEVTLFDGTPLAGSDWVIPRALRGEAGTNEEYRLHRRDTGDTWYASYSFAAIRDSAGAIIGAIAVARDVTAKKQAEDALHQAEQRLEAHMKNSPLAIIEFDSGFHVLRWSDEAERVFGYSAQEILGRSIGEMHWVYEDDAPIVEAEMSRFLSGSGTRSKNVNRNYRKDGSVIWCEWYSSAIYDDAGQLASVLSLVLDITKRRQNEEALSESEARLRAVLENSMDAPYRRNMTIDRYDYISPAIEAITGFSPEEFANLTTDEVVSRIHADDLPEVERWLEKGDRTGRIISEYRFRRKDGRWVWMADRATVVKDEQGRPLYRTGVVRDVTEAKRVAEALRESEERFRTVVENVRDGVNMLDLASGRYVLMNAAQVELTGFTLDEINNISAEEALERVHPDDRDISSKQQEQIATGETQSAMVEYRWRVKSGEYRWFSDRRSVVRDVNGKPVALVGVSRDITERKRHEEDLAFLARLSDDFSHLSSPLEIMNTVAEQTAKHFEHSLCFLVEVDEERNRLVVHAGRHTGTKDVEGEGRRLSAVYTEDMRTIARYGRTLVIRDMERENGSRYFAYRPDPIGALVSVPFIQDGKWRYQLTITCEQAREWSAEEIKLIEDIATRTFPRVERAYAEEALERSLAETKLLAEREQKTAQLLVALSEIDAAIHSSLDFSQVAHRALKGGAEAIGADVAAIDGIEGDEWVVWYDYGVDPTIVGHRFTNAQNPHGVQAIRRGETVAIDDAFNDPRVDNEVMKAYGLKSTIVAPLIVRGQPMGALYFNNVHEVHHYTKQEENFVYRLASSLALAIDNARLYQSQRHIADELQEALLSLPSHIPCIEFAHAYHSAAEAARVGGDFYDLFELNSNYLGVIIGDVAGKGLDAAVLTSLVKNTIRAHANEKGKTPSQILKLTNDVVYKATTSELFVTIFFGMLDRRDGRFVYANGGHTTSMVVRRDDGVVRLPVTGPILGAFPEVEFDQAETQLDVGDLLFLYTDGLTEARRGRELYGETRLLEYMKSVVNMRPEEVIEGVIGEVLSFSGQRLSDDLAMLAMTRSEDDVEAPHQQKLEIWPSRKG